MVKIFGVRSGSHIYICLAQPKTYMTHDTLQNYEVYTWWTCVEKSFKICQIFWKYLNFEFIGRIYDSVRSQNQSCSKWKTKKYSKKMLSISLENFIKH